MVETAVSKFGGLDILINNAGTSYRNKPTLEVTEAEFDRVMNVNVKSIFFSIGAVVPELQKRGGGSIVNVASIGAMRPRPGLVWYNASKGAVANVCLKWRVDLVEGKELIMIISLGIKRPRSRIRKVWDPSQCAVPIVVRYRSLLNLCWG
jgi:NAD(P)-dependent dehydrogenase (short-subunit alcohol dehydrogenase family)